LFCFVLLEQKHATRQRYLLRCFISCALDRSISGLLLRTRAIIIVLEPPIDPRCQYNNLVTFPAKRLKRTLNCPPTARQYPNSLNTLGGYLLVLISYFWFRVPRIIVQQLTFLNCIRGTINSGSLNSQQSNQPTPWSIVLIEQLTVTQLIKKFPHLFMKPEVSLSFSQEPVTGLYPEPDASSLHPPTLFL